MVKLGRVKYNFPKKKKSIITKSWHINFVEYLCGLLYVPYLNFNLEYYLIFSQRCRKYILFSFVEIKRKRNILHKTKGCG
jgi:hypothetical protein